MRQLRVYGDGASGRSLRARPALDLRGARKPAQALSEHFGGRHTAAPQEPRAHVPVQVARPRQGGPWGLRTELLSVSPVQTGLLPLEEGAPP